MNSKEIKELEQRIIELEKENIQLKNLKKDYHNSAFLLDLLSQCSNHAELITNSNDTFIFANAGLASLFEISNLEISNNYKKVFDCFDKKDFARYKKKLTTKKSFNERVSIITKSGKAKSLLLEQKSKYINEDDIYIFHTRFDEIVDDNQLSTDVLNGKTEELNQEINKRLHVEKALTESEAKLRGFVDQSSNGIFFIDVNGTIAEWNNRACELLGIERTKIKNRKILELGDILEENERVSTEVKNDLQRKIKAYLDSFKQNAGSFTYDIELMSNEKQHEHVEITMYPVVVNNETFLGGFIRDISLEKKTETEFEKYQEYLEDVLKERTLELINSEHRIRNLSDSLPGGAIFRVIRTDDHGLTLDYVSGNFYELLGVNREIDFYDLNHILKNIHPIDLDAFDQQSKISKNTLVDFNIEVRYFMPNGSMKWFHIRAKVNVSEQDKVYWDGYIIDTTEKNIYHSELQEREALLKSVIENIPYDFWACDENGRYFIQSEASKAYWGDLLGKNLKDVDIPESSKIVFQNTLYKVEKGEVVNEENEIYDVNGDKYFFQNIAGPLIINNHINGALGFNIDITERKNVEKKLVQNEDKFRNIFNKSTDGIIIHSIEGEIFELNTTFSVLKNLNEDDVLDSSIFDFFNSDTAIRFREELKKLSNSNADIVLEAYLKADDLTLIPIEVKSTLMRYLGKNAILTIIRNVSYRKRFERQLLDAIIETEEKERAKLAADLHDEIGPLLSSLKLYISLLKDTNDIEKSNYVGKQIFELVTEAIMSVREISNSLSPHVLTNYGLIEAVKNVIQNVGSLISINFTSNCEEQRFASNTETVYYRIFKELLNNTIKHAKARNIEIKFIANGDTLTFAYKDDGIGFDYEEKSDNKKDGMGLFNIINRAKTINANYIYKSKPGEGTYFEMTTSIELL